MIRPLALYIGLRYTRAKRRNHFISFISFASMLGIALGVMVLITVLSVMNGFDHQIRQRVFAIMPQVTVLTNLPIEKDWQKFSKEIANFSQVQSIAPYVSGKGMVVKGSLVSGVEVIGVLPRYEKHISKIASKMVEGTFSSLTPGSFNIVISRALAQELDVRMGGRVSILTPQTTVTLAGIFPRFKVFTVSGIYHLSSGFGYFGVGYVNMQDAAKLYPPGQGLRGLHIKLNNPYLAYDVSEKLRAFLPPTFAVTNWTAQFGAYFQAIVMEKTILFIILLLIVAVAAFNLVSTLVMVVNDKRADIAILRTLGASRATIMGAFIVQGTVVGLIGTAIGIIFGVILSLNATQIVNWFQKAFGLNLISSSVFFVNYLPSELQISDVVFVALIAILLSLLATLYPAWVAFRTQPAEALRYE